MENTIPAEFLAAITQIFAIATSIIWLSIQRLIKRQDKSTETNSFESDDIRDVVNNPFSNGNRISRIIFDTIILSAVSGYTFILHVAETPTTYGIIAKATTFIAWLYCFVLAITASRYPLPNPTGWRLNIHLCIIYTILFFSSSVNMISALWQNTGISFMQALPIFLPVIFGLDLVYTTATVKNGSRFLDGDGFVIPVLNYATPFFLNRFLIVIQEITSGHGDERSFICGLGNIFGLATFIVIANILVEQLWFFAQSSTQMRTKSMLNMEIYRKTLRRMDTVVLSGGGANRDEKKDAEKNKDEEDSTSSTGMVVNLMSTDSSRISDFASWWFVLIEAPVQLGVGVYFLYTLLGWSAILGLSTMIITIPINHYNSNLFLRTQEKVMKARDKRVSLMNEVLQGIRQIKFFAWEANWSKRILEARNLELGYLRLVYFSEIIFMILWQSTPILVTTIAFWSFTKIEGKELTAPIAFTSITIFNDLRFSLTVIPETVTRLFETFISLNRIDKFLTEDEIITTHPVSFDVIIGFKNATISWPSKPKIDTNPTFPEQDTFTLKDLNVVFPNNKLSLVCGPTGSGKSLIMLSLLGETETHSGSVLFPRSTYPNNLDDSAAVTSIKVCEDADIIPEHWILQHAVAYVSQTAWLQNNSIKNNILFGLPFAEKRYKAVLTACALDKDINYLEDGDETEIGEKGITLSGGQKARVALARAVYSRAQNILMDDVLSAVDAHTAKHLYKKCLTGPLMNGRTQVLITHYVNLCIQGSSYVVFVKNGGIQLSGSPAELKQENKLALIFEENVKSDDYEEEEETIRELDTIQEIKKAKILVEDENRASGTVKLRLYRLYFKLLGNWFFWSFIVVSIIGVRCLDVSSSWWLKKWAQSYETTSGTIPSHSLLISQINNMASIPSVLSEEKHKESLNRYLIVYVLFNISITVVAIVRQSATFMGGIKASRKLYTMLLDRVLYAPLRFFDTTPVGRIVNRFSNDFETIDSSVPSDFIQFCVQWTVVLSIFFVATFVLPTLAILMIAVAVINVYFGLKFVTASMELKRMDSVSRSPLFTLFGETIVGVTTIRAFGMTQQFMLEMLRRVDTNARPMFYVWTMSRWVSPRISIMGALIAFVTGAAILLNLDHLDAATAGFCLSYVLAFTQMTFWGVRRYTQLEMNFNSVERVVEFLEMEQESPTITNIRPPSNVSYCHRSYSWFANKHQWPSEGSVQVTNLHVKYAPDLEPVLKGLSFSIKGKEKIGIVGRTGSGKSTLALAFFRFIESTEGSIVIDNINIADIGTKDLRSKLTIIPQDPVLFSGTLRSNMDPFDEFDEEAIYTALRRVHLMDDTLDNENIFADLNTVVSEGGNNFSQGQRQLLCLARALLKRSKIVLMDEATASVDFETDRAIQKTITQEFADSTILCIAHRLNTVIEYDRILVLDHGEIIEFSSPLELLRDIKSAFYKMCRNSGEYENLLELAKKKHELIDIL
ncbi:hypothetical protein INT47_002119 [Mucor saturninus]|uniref:P-loop containing nucleoside triphosphate hydrolase protein n=1 Tax=Mucor saturninus TaxID=64648 RepID=A0A8H7R277_9FUNG|nr:hypothetical protein INT47_002119 [Mucor saturninus]